MPFINILLLNNANAIGWALPVVVNYYSTGAAFQRNTASCPQCPICP
ncbi:MAG: hypothetical protein LBC02_12450 [Planctomycetaceae bacterium]|nr:hypothetical protein [Planctomycetaceae bacterium]